MKLSTLTLALVILAINLTFAAPKLEIEGGNTYNWGTHSYKKSPLKADIKLKNIGDENLIIKEVKPGCGCTASPVDKDTVKPGDFATMNVSLNTSTYTGDITKSIRISTNDPSSPDSYLFLKTNVYRPLIVLPNNYLAKSTIPVGKEEVFTFKLKNQTEKPIKIDSLKITPSEAITSVKEGTVLEPNKEQEFTISVTVKEKGRLSGSLKLLTNNPDAGDVVLYFYGNVVADEPVPEPALEKK